MSKTIFFLHLPKSGGLTFQNILKNEFGQDDTIELRPDPKKYTNFCSQLEWLQYTDEYCEYISDDIRSKKVYMGHFYYGVHEYFNIQDYIYISFLRNPVDRAVSEFYYFKKLKYDIFNKMNSDLNINNVTLDEYVKYVMTDNIQTRMLSGIRHYNKSNEVTDKTFRQAIENLKGVLVGITERYDDSLKLINKKMNLKINKYQKVNTRQSNEYHELTAAQRSEILKKNLFDSELYDHFNKEFDIEYKSINSRSYYNNLKEKILNVFKANSI